MPVLTSLNFSSDIQVDGSELDINNMDPSCFLSMVQAATGGLMVQEIFFWPFGSFTTN